MIDSIMKNADSGGNGFHVLVMPLCSSTLAVKVAEIQRRILTRIRKTIRLTNNIITTYHCALSRVWVLSVNQTVTLNIRGPVCGLWKIERTEGSRQGCSRVQSEN